jgi:hypothetical protein
LTAEDAADREETRDMNSSAELIDKARAVLGDGSEIVAA